MIALFEAVKIWIHFLVSSVRIVFNKLFIQYRNKIMERDDVLKKIRELKALIGNRSRIDDDGDTINSKASIKSAADKREPLQLINAEYNIVEPKMISKTAKGKQMRAEYLEEQKSKSLPKPKNAVRIERTVEEPKSVVEDSESEKVKLKVTKPKKVDNRSEEQKALAKERMAKLRELRKSKKDNPKAEGVTVETPKAEKEKKPRKPRASKKSPEDADDKDASKYVRPI